MTKHINKTLTCNFERCLRYRRVEDLQLLNDIHSDSGKDVSDFIFPWDKQRRKRTPYLLWAHCFRPSSLVSNPKWRLHDKGLQHSYNILKARRTPKFPSSINKPSLEVFVTKESAKTRVVEKLKRCASECAFCCYFWFNQTSRSLHSNDHYTQAGAAIFWSLQWYFSWL